MTDATDEIHIYPYLLHAEWVLMIASVVCLEDRVKVTRFYIVTIYFIQLNNVTSFKIVGVESYKGGGGTK